MLHAGVVPLGYVVLLGVLEVALGDTRPHETVNDEDNLGGVHFQPVRPFHTLLCELKLGLTNDTPQSQFHGLFWAFEPFFNLSSEDTISQWDNFPLATDHC